MLPLVAAFLLAATSGSLVAGAQPNAGSVYVYHMSFHVTINGSIMVGHVNGTLSCTLDKIVKVINKTDNYIVFNITSSNVTCNETGDFGPASGLKDALKSSLEGNASKILRVPVNKEFDPDNMSIYVSPSRLPKNGTFSGTTKSESSTVTYKVVYDTGTGMLKEAHVKAVSNNPTGMISMVTSYDIVLTSSKTVGGSFLSKHGLAISAIIIVVIIAVAAYALGRRVLGG